MKIAAVTKGSEIAASISDGTEVLIVTEEGGVPTAKEVIEIGEMPITSVLFRLGTKNIDTLLAGEVGTALQSTLRMLGINLLPGCQGDAIDNIAGYLANEDIGDPSKIVIPEEDEDDPLNCLHDCSKCMAGCHNPQPNTKPVS